MSWFCDLALWSTIFHHKVRLLEAEFHSFIFCYYSYYYYFSFCIQKKVIPLLLYCFPSLKKNPFNMSFREFSLYSSGYRKKKKQWSGHLYSRRGHLYSKIWKQLKNMHNSFTSLTYQCTAVKWVIQTLLWEEITMTPKTCGRDRTQ